MLIGKGAIVSENKIIYTSLVPNADESVDSTHAYLDALNWGVTNPEVHNIALTGTYGSGKSSILKKYQNAMGDDNGFLRIFKKGRLSVSKEKLKSRIAKCKSKMFFRGIRTKCLETVETWLSKNNEEMESTVTACQNIIGSSDKKALSINQIEEICKEIEKNFPEQKLSKAQIKYKKSFTISLANFKESESQIDLPQIEQAVLEQFFYKEDPNKLPYSRFKRINPISLGKFLLFYVVVVILLLVGLFLLNPMLVAQLQSINQAVSTNFPHFGPCKWDLPLSSEFWYCIMLCELIALVFVIGFATYWILNRMKVHSIKIYQSSIEIVDKSAADSIFNKYLDEIVYFFEASKYELVIFEDLDRFDNVDIFVKLRALNDLLNSNSRIKKKITFIYAIKDDLFEGETRTKFFDFIIPVVPIINSTNSNEQLRSALRANDITEEDISDAFINDVSVFLEDMRTLHNIVNEFLLYREVLQKRFLSAEKLFSIIMYKNLCPADFANLHSSESMLRNFFEQINILTQQLCQKKEEDREQLLTLLQSKDLELVENEKQLKILFLYELDLLNGNSLNSIYLSTRDNQYRATDFLQDSAVEFQELTGYQGRHSIEFEKATEKYQQRLNSSKEAYQKQQLEKIVMLQSEISDIKQRTIVDWCRSEQAEDLTQMLAAAFKTDADIQSGKNLSLCEFFLSRGYIDQTHSDYISYFYEGQLSLIEHDFLVGVKERKSKEFNYKLKNVAEILKRMTVADFHSRAFFNTSLLKELLKSTVVDSRIYTQAMRVLCNGTPKSNEFVFHYWRELKEADDRALFIKAMVSHCNDFWAIIAEQPDLLDEERKQLFKEIHLYADASMIIARIQTEKFAEYTLAQPDYCTLLQDVNLGKAQAIINRYQITFVDLQEKSLTPLLKYIFENGYFAVNFNMIALAMKIGGEITENDFNTKNYTAIIEGQKEFPWLYTKVKENLSIYIEDVFLRLKQNQEIGDDNSRAQIIIPLVKDSSLTDAQRIEIVKKVEFVFDHIADAPPSIWSELMQSKIFVKPCLENVLGYYRNNKYDVALSTFLCEHSFDKEDIDHVLAFKVSPLLTDLLNRLEKAGGTKVAEHKIRAEIGVVKNLIQDKNIPANKWERLIEKIETETFNRIGVDISELDDSRLGHLIKGHYIAWSTYIYEQIRMRADSSSTKLHIAYLAASQMDCEPDISNINLSKDDLIALLQRCFPNELKDELIEQYSKWLQDDDFAKAVSRYRDNQKVTI